MLNYWKNLTPEQRQKILDKSAATKKATRERRQAMYEDAEARRFGLKNEIEKLENKLASLQRMEIISGVSASLTTKALLFPEEIVKASMPWNRTSGVYFLIDNSEIVYVGQAVNVYARIDQHSFTKTFSHYAFVPCKKELLDRLESLYIHFLRPKLNSNTHDSAKLAPLPLDELIGLSEIAPQRKNK